MYEFTTDCSYVGNNYYIIINDLVRFGSFVVCSVIRKRRKRLSLESPTLLTMSSFIAFTVVVVLILDCRCFYFLLFALCCLSLNCVIAGVLPLLLLWVIYFNHAVFFFV